MQVTERLDPILIREQICQTYQHDQGQCYPHRWRHGKRLKGLFDLIHLRA